MEQSFDKICIVRGSLSPPLTPPLIKFTGMELQTPHNHHTPAYPPIC